MASLFCMFALPKKKIPIELAKKIKKSGSCNIKHGPGQSCSLSLRYEFLSLSASFIAAHMCMCFYTHTHAPNRQQGPSLSGRPLCVCAFAKIFKISPQWSKEGSAQNTRHIKENRKKHKSKHFSEAAAVEIKYEFIYPSETACAHKHTLLLLDGGGKAAAQTYTRARARMNRGINLRGASCNEKWLFCRQTSSACHYKKRNNLVCAQAKCFVRAKKY